MLSERVKDWTKNCEQQGIEKWLQKRAVGRTAGELQQLKRCLGSIDEAIRSRVKLVDSQTLLTWGEGYW